MRFLASSLFTLFLSGIASAQSFDIDVKMPEADYYSDNLTVSLTLQQSQQKEITAIEVAVDGEKPVIIPVKEIRGKTYKVKVKGFELGAVQGQGMNQAGEGVVRILPKPQFIAKGIPGYIDVQLKRVGPDKNWILLTNNTFVKNARFVLDKNIYAESGMSLLFSSPKITQMKVNPVGCSWSEVSDVVNKYISSEMMRYLNCNGKLGISEKTNILSDVLGTDGVYEDFYVKSNNHKKQLAQIPQKLAVLKTIGIDLEKMNPQDFLNSEDYVNLKTDFMGSSVRSGNFEMLNYLIGLGYKPTADAMTTAFLNVYQYDQKKGTLVTSSTGQKIFDLMRAHTVEIPSAGRIIYDGIESGNSTVPYDSPKLQAAYLSVLIDAAAAEGLDFNAEYLDYKNAAAAFLDRVDLTDISDAQTKQLLAKIKSHMR